MSTQLLNAPLRSGQMVPNQYEVKGQVGFSQIVQQWPLRIEFPCSEKITIDKVKSFSLQILFPVLGQTLERFYFLLQKRKMFVATFRIRRIILQKNRCLPLLCAFSYYLLTLHTVVCIKVRTASFPRFWKNHSQCRKK